MKIGDTHLQMWPRIQPRENFWPTWARKSSVPMMEKRNKFQDPFEYGNFPKILKSFQPYPQTLYRHVRLGTHLWAQVPFLFQETRKQQQQMLETPIGDGLTLGKVMTPVQDPAYDTSSLKRSKILCFGKMHRVRSSSSCIFRKSQTDVYW